MKKETRDAAITHAIASYPQESCGLVIIRKGREVYYPCRNTAKTKQDHFVISTQDLIAAEDMGEVIAIVHSHPDESSSPSDSDRVGCENSQLPWYILSIGQEDGKAPYFHSEHAISPCGYKAPLVGRQFFHGVLDCYAIVRDFYKEEFGIDLINFERTDEWWNRGENLYMKNIEAAGFVRVEVDELKYGDVIIMQIRADEPNHAGVYIGDGWFLHHFYGRLSSRDIYGGYWKEKTTSVVRHKDKL